MNDDERRLVQSITMKEIHGDLFNLLETTFIRQTNGLTASHGEKARTGIITLLSINTYLVKHFDFKYSGYVSWMVFNWLKSFLNKNDKSSLTTFGMSSDPSFRIPWTISMKGNRVLVKDTTQMSVKYIRPSIIHANKIEYFDRPSISLFEFSKPDYIINMSKLANE